MATTVNNSPSGVQTRFTRRSRPPPLNEIPQVVTRNSRRQVTTEPLNEPMMSVIHKGPDNSSYLRERCEQTGNMCELSVDKTSNNLISYCDSDGLLSGNYVDSDGDMLMNGEDDEHNIREEDSKSKSGKQLRTMVNRLAPTPGFVDKNSLPSDLMTRSRVRRVASLNAAAKCNAIFEQTSPLAGRSITDIMTHSKKVSGGEDEFSDEDHAMRPKGRPRLANLSTNNSNFLRSSELPPEAAHSYIRNYDSENLAGLKRLQDNEGECYEAKRTKFDQNGSFMMSNFEQNSDYSTVVTEKRFLKGKEVVDVGLQVKLPKLHCTCRSSNVVDIPVKSYVSTYANGTLVSIPITKTHRLTPHPPEKPHPELAQGDLACRSKRVAGMNSRAMLNAILCEERQFPPGHDVPKPPTKKFPQKKSYYQHGLNNTVPSKLKIPKINFAATSTSNFGGKRMFGTSQKTPGVLWSKSGLASHDGPKRTNGWFYLGSPIVKPYYYNDTKVMRNYYIGIKRNDEVIYVRDSVLLKSGPRRKDLPFVARVSGFWEEKDGPHEGEMMMSVLWYYRPEQTEMGKQPDLHGENEILASRHKDDNSVACIVDKCYVLSYPEYCRHRAAMKRRQNSRVSSSTRVPPAESAGTSRAQIPSTCDPKLVFFCRQIYDYRMGRILKNPLYV